jgi:alkanesulfonate monooxygenase SsuD/methylene tetrahydromethanopterin reductase-like flavin-dependent oxidoreductase (luciferase family)
MANHGTDARRRMAVLRERVEAMKAIWTQPEASYAGEHVAFERIWCWPKPVQAPHPPVLVGGQGPTVLDRVLSFGDGWAPNHARGAVLERIPELRARADDAGRRVTVDVFGVPADPHVLEQYQQAGVRRCIHWVPSAARPLVERSLEPFEAAVAELHGE